ncbi:MAG: GAF domain-containing protein [Synergistetes bacterium]|nr:GAF domain-containing protein [Synergistota bacterium]
MLSMLVVIISTTYVVDRWVLTDYISKQLSSFFLQRLAGIRQLVDGGIIASRLAREYKGHVTKLVLKDDLRRVETFLQMCDSWAGMGILDVEDAKKLALNCLKQWDAYVLDASGRALVFPERAIELSKGFRRYTKWTVFKPWGWKVGVMLSEESVFGTQYGSFDRRIKSAILKRVSYIPSNGSYVVIYNRDRKIISYPHEKISEDDLPSSPYMKKVFLLKSGSFTYTFKGRRKERIFSYVPLIGWYIVFTAYPDEMYYPTLVGMLKGELPAVVVVVVVLWILGFYVWDKRILSPLMQVSAGFEELGKGNYRYRLEPGSMKSPYVEGLFDDFNEMMDRLREGEEELVKAYRKLEVLNANISRRYDDLQRELERLRVLDKVIDATVSLVEHEEIASKVVDILVSTGRYSDIGILLRDGDTLRRVAHHGIVWDKFEVFPIDKGVSGWVVREREVRNVPDVLADEHYVEGNPAVRSELACPIVAGNEAIGVIDVESTEPSFFERDDEIMLKMVADYLAVAFRRADTVKLLQKRLKGMRFLRQLLKEVSTMRHIDKLSEHVCNMVRDYSNCNNVAMYIKDGNSLILTYVAGLPMPEDVYAVDWGVLNIYGKGISARAARTGTVQNVANCFEDPDYVMGDVATRSEIAAPIKVGSEVFAVMDLESVEFNAFGKEDEHLLSLISENLGSIIRKVELIEGLEDMVRSLEERNRELTLKDEELEASLEQLRAYTRELEAVHRDMVRKERELEEVYLDTIKALARAIEMKDPYAKGHASRVADYAVKVGKVMDLNEEDMRNLMYAALLHDIGRIGLRGTVLDKPCELTEKEIDYVKGYPASGASVLMQIDYLRDVAKVILHHKERWDGRGYPAGLKGEEIPLLSRIIAVVDAYDAMISDRPYRKALSHREAVKKIKEGSGAEFDPRVVEAFLKVVEG